MEIKNSEFLGRREELLVACGFIKVRGDRVYEGGRSEGIVVGWIYFFVDDSCKLSIIVFKNLKVLESS